MSKFDKPWQAFAFVSAIGVDLAICTVGGFWLGTTIDDKFGTDPWFLLIGLLTGLAIGIYSVYRMIKPFLGD